MSVLGAVRIPRRQGSLDFGRGAAATLVVVTVVALVALVVQLFTVRPDYLAALWNVGRWDAVAVRFDAARGG